MKDLIMIIDLMSAMAAMVAFFIVIAKFITKRIKAKKADRFLMKIHRPAGYVLVVTGLIHGMFSFRVFNTTPVIVYILGFICLLAIVAAIATFFLKKKLGKKWLIWHRVTTIIALLALVAHVMLYNA